jgi:hypothetical protein
MLINLLYMITLVELIYIVFEFVYIVFELLIVDQCGMKQVEQTTNATHLSLFNFC